MSGPEKRYDVAIIGGGLAGLALSIQLAKAGHGVCVLEKEKYPFHRVCGEYISLESWNFLEGLGVPLKEWQPPILDTLLLTSPKGKTFAARLPLGGFGISRYTLDSTLAHLAQQSGVTLLQETRAEEVEGAEEYRIRVASRDPEICRVSGGVVRAHLCCGAYGKRSNLDIRWKRSFLRKGHQRPDNYVGVKYHVQTDWKENVIGLHNFRDGYCGISKVEGDRFCLCYMTRAENLRARGGDISLLEDQVLSQNPHLKGLFRDSVRLDSFPVTISQISFQPKTQVERGMLLLGDAAGMITPLCGNGMSMALHASKIAFQCTNAFLRGYITRQAMESSYQQQWQRLFACRLQAGRILQHFFGNEAASNLFVRTLRTFPFLATPVIRLTYGVPF